MESGDAKSHVVEQQEQPPFRSSPVKEQMPIKRFKFSPLTQGKAYVYVNHYGLGNWNHWV